MRNYVKQYSQSYSCTYTMCILIIFISLTPKSLNLHYRVPPSILIFHIFFYLLFNIRYIFYESVSYISSGIAPFFFTRGFFLAYKMACYIKYIETDFIEACLIALRRYDKRRYIIGPLLFGQYEGAKI